MTLDCTSCVTSRIWKCPGSRHAPSRRHWLIIMSTLPDIDNDDTLFQFDPYEGLASGAPSFGMHLKTKSEFTAQDLAPPMSSHDESTTSGELDLGLEILVQSTITKGKERTEPMAIRPSSIVYDLFDSSPTVASPSSSRAYASSSSSTAFSPSSYSFSSPRFDDSRYRHRTPSVESMEQLDASDIESSSLDSPPSSKGKERESFPFLPPLTFSLIQLNPDHGFLPAPSQSPYDKPSGNVRHSPLLSANEILPILSPTTESSSSERNLQDAQEDTVHPISRSQSFSNLAQQIPVPSEASLDRPSTIGPSRIPSNLSLIFEKRDNPINSKFSDKPIEASTPATPISTPVITDLESGDDSATAWYTVSSPYGLPIVQTQPSAIPSLPEHLRLNSSTRILLKGQPRFMLSPPPISALDFVPITSTDIFQSFPIVIQDYFDLLLPKELRLQIFRELVHVHEREHLRLVSSGRFTATKASYSRNRWVGRDRGIRELFKLSRVCFRG